MSSGFIRIFRRGGSAFFLPNSAPFVCASAIWTLSSCSSPQELSPAQEAKTSSGGQSAAGGATSTSDGATGGDTHTGGTKMSGTGGETSSALPFGLDNSFCASALTAAEAQLRGFLAAYEGNDKTNEIPRAFDGTEVDVRNAYDWTSGFVAGTLWHLYDFTRDETVLAQARSWTEALAEQQYYAGDHDLGFKIMNSYGKGYLLADVEEYLPIILQTSTTLMTRYSSVTGVIESWDSFGSISYPVIIDNMMNLEMLFFASKAGGSQAFFEAATSHADTTLENHFRPDGSSYHVVGYDPNTGEATAKVTAQGLADSSAWARGQAWGLYGYAMSYRETGEVKYLEQARKIATFLIDNPDTPEDGVYYFDFDAPHREDVPDYRDASATAISASALLELHSYLPDDEAEKVLSFALHQLETLTSPSYAAQLGENGHFLLMHSVGHYPAGSEVDVAINYADYYYMEALLRCSRLVEVE